MGLLNNGTATHSLIVLMKLEPEKVGFDILDQLVFLWLVFRGVCGFAGFAGFGGFLAFVAFVALHCFTHPEILPQVHPHQLTLSQSLKTSNQSRNPP